MGARTGWHGHGELPAKGRGDQKPLATRDTGGHGDEHIARPYDGLDDPRQDVEGKLCVGRLLNPKPN